MRFHNARATRGSAHLLPELPPEPVTVVDHERYKAIPSNRSTQQQMDPLIDRLSHCPGNTISRHEEMKGCGHECCSLSWRFSEGYSCLSSHPKAERG